MSLRWFTTVVLCWIFAYSYSHASYRFGYPGQNGSDGFDGRDGHSAQSVSKVINGQSESLILNGTDGSDAGNASQGFNATSCWQPTSDYDVYGATGGDGGEGGDGGDGGNGGNLVLSFDDINHLKNVYVENMPGHAGRGGYGANGGYGCQCRDYNWSIRHCTRDYYNPRPGYPNPGYRTNCHYHYYSCRDGRNGSFGRHGSNGTSGSYGSITLIPSTQPLPAENKTYSLKAPNIDPTKLIVLYHHVWQNESGIQSLLAPGSKVSGSYRMYKGLSYAKIGFKWAANARQSDFSDLEISASFHAGQGAPAFDVHGDVWVASHVERQGDAYVYVVDRAIRESDLNNINLLGIEGSRETFAFNLQDGLKDRQDVKTTYMIDMRSKRFIFSRHVLDSQVINPSLITVTPEGAVKIAVTNLFNPRFVKPKRKVTGYIRVTRTFQNYTMSKTLPFSFKIAGVTSAAEKSDEE